MSDKQASDVIRGGRHLPSKQSLVVGAGALAVIEPVVFLSHFGATGVVVGGLAAFVAARHGSSLIEPVMRLIPERSEQLPPQQQGSSLPTKRSFADRAFGRFPQLALPHNDDEAKGEVLSPPMPSLQDRQKYSEWDDEEEDTVLVEEFEMPSTCASSSTPLGESSHMLHLAPGFSLEVNEFLAAGCFTVGMKGSGKSYFAGLLMEQLSQFPIPQVVYDIKGDYLSLIEEGYFKQGRVMRKGGEYYSAERIISEGLQVVVDLRTWGSLEEQAQVMAHMNESLMAYTGGLPEEDRVPYPVHLDEAQQYLAETRPFLLTKETWQRVIASFANLGVLARSYGAVPCIYTQRMADIEKSVIASQELRIFMKAALDNDFKRYYEYVNKEIATREQIQRFGYGDAVVVAPRGEQFLTHFYSRVSRHNSHTPHVTGALHFYQQRQQSQPLVAPVAPVVATRRLPEQAGPVARKTRNTDELLTPERYERFFGSPSQPTSVNNATKLPLHLEKTLEVYRPGMSYRSLSMALKRHGLDVNKDTAGKWLGMLKAMQRI